MFSRLYAVIRDLIRIRHPFFAERLSSPAFWSVAEKCQVERFVIPLNHRGLLQNCLLASPLLR